MNVTTMSVGSVAFACMLAFVQSGASTIDDAKNVMSQFIAKELIGARLQSTSLDLVKPFVVQPSTLRPVQTMFVVSADFDLTELPVSADTTNISVFFHDYYGILDQALRFKPAPKTAPGGGILKRGISSDYRLACHSRPTSKRDSSEQNLAHGTDECKILAVQQAATIGLNTAIKYVNDVRQKTTDQAVQDNAVQALTVLHKLH